MRKVGVESKSNNGSRTERPRWADYEDFEEDVDDFEDEAIGKVFDSLKTEETSGIELQANSIRGDISVTLGDMMM
jgi:cytochrome c556